MERKYAIINWSDISEIDFSEIYQTDINNLSRTLDGTKCIIKWCSTDTIPNFLNNIEYLGPYSHDQILEIIASPEWNNTEIDF